MFEMTFCIVYIVICILTMIGFGIKVYRESCTEDPDWTEFMPVAIAGIFWPISLSLILIIGFSIVLGYVCKKLSNCIDEIKDYNKYDQ